MNRLITIAIAISMASCAKDQVQMPSPCTSKTEYQVLHKLFVYDNGDVLLSCSESSPCFDQRDAYMPETRIQLTDTAFISSQLMDQGWKTDQCPMTWAGCMPATIGCRTVSDFTGDQLSWYQRETSCTIIHYLAEL